MNTLQRMDILKESLSDKRFKHSIGVMETAVKLAEHYNLDIVTAQTAGLLHDCARDIRGNLLYKMCSKYNIKMNYILKSQPELIHGVLGVYIAKEKYEVNDKDILESIKWHTTGRDNMTLLDKVIYIADYIEPSRNFVGIEEVRDTVYKDLDKALLMALDRTIKYVMMREVYIHPDTVKARNGIIRDIRAKG